MCENPSTNVFMHTSLDVAEVPLTTESSQGLLFKRVQVLLWEPASTLTLSLLKK